ncbi:MAG TPA: protein translocase subunit SecF [Gemmatimonadales bacterium]|nr:protein translocase subunit SecF [Gemmatimonadales bacterium]
MFRLFANARYDFIKWRKWAYGLTALLIIPGLIYLIASGVNYSIEFTGGTQVQIATLDHSIGAAQIRAALDAGGMHGTEISSFGADTAFMIRARLGETNSGSQQAVDSTVRAVRSAFDNGLGPTKYNVMKYEGIDGKVGKELQGKAFLAIFFSFFVTLAYLAIRFEWRFGTAAVLATAHDILTTIAFIKYMNLEISLVVVGAVLTMVGYSLNDTIIIFDRVRENLRKFRRQNLYDIVNLSINETLPRSILTHGTTFATTTALVVLGGEVIRPFALVMAFAIFTGTFSSIYIAAPILMYIEKRWPGEDARGARILTSPMAMAPAGAVPPAPTPAAAPAPAPQPKATKPATSPAR